ncbi:unnamed protein product [Leptidea sinapis]|uniref:Uncharacterized protein n=1 Tax=Leptidea sinapis TaxID=189913 RepID=A0A5E4QRL2_9NEOP|nr:unnamed protein product [Leptidea sinapis]
MDDLIILPIDDKDQEPFNISIPDQGSFYDIQDTHVDFETNTSKTMPKNLPLEKQDVFDTSTPKAMLKKPVSALLGVFEVFFTKNHS